MSDKDPILMNEDFDFQDFSNTIISIPDDTPTIPATKFDDYNGIVTYYFQICIIKLTFYL